MKNKANNLSRLKLKSKGKICFQNGFYIFGEISMTLRGMNSCSFKTKIKNLTTDFYELKKMIITCQRHIFLAFTFAVIIIIIIVLY